MITRKLITVMATAMVMSACSPAAETSASATEVADNAKAGISETCKNHPLLAAMPAFQEVAGKKPLSMDCNRFSVDMFWGDEGDSVWVQIVDSQASLGDAPDPLEQTARDLSFEAAKTGVSTSEDARKLGLSQPDIVAMFGGPDFLPVVDTGPSGLHYTIRINRQSDGGAAEDLIGYVQDRYAVKIHMDNTRAIGGTAGQAAYAPWLGALRLSALQ